MYHWGLGVFSIRGMGLHTNRHNISTPLPAHLDPIWQEHVDLSLTLESTLAY